MHLLNKNLTTTNGFQNESTFGGIQKDGGWLRNFWETGTILPKLCIDLRETILRRITGLLSGYNPLRKHSRKLGLAEDASCRFVG